MSLSTLESRNKNANKTKIDYDLNIFMSEVLDAKTQEYYYDPTAWNIHVYVYEGQGHTEFAEPYQLSPEEIRALGLNNDSYFEGGDVWYGLDGYLPDYWDVMPDSVKRYLESLPKYLEDLG